MDAAKSPRHGSRRSNDGEARQRPCCAPESAAARTEAAQPRFQPAPGESGFGLVEVMIAVLLMSLLIGGMTLGLITAIRTTGDNQVRQRLQASLSAYADSLQQMPYVTGACSARDTAGYNSAYAAWSDRWNPPPGVTVSVAGAVRYWDRTAKDFVNTCPSTDTGAVLLNIKASRGALAATGQVVKRNPEATP